MWLKILLVVHITVLGYWLGSELVINSTYRYVARSASMPFAERGRLMQHVMHVDQHVRYALVLQAGLGFALAAVIGYLPGGAAAAWASLVLCTLWLGWVEAVHPPPPFRCRRAAGRAGPGFTLSLHGPAAGTGGRGAGRHLADARLAADQAGTLRDRAGLRNRHPAGTAAALPGWAAITRDGASDEDDAAILAISHQATAALALL